MNMNTQIQNLIDEIESVSLESEFAYEIFYKIFRTKLTKIALIGFDLDPHPELFYVRARPLEGLSDHFLTISDHSYNPDPKSIKYGRANLPGQQVFYIGRTRATSLGEVNIIENRKEEKEVAYSLSRWKNAKKMKFAAILNINKVDMLDCDELNGFLAYFKQNYITFENLGYIEFYKYMSDKFSEIVLRGNENKYKLTSAFANFMHEIYPGISGLMYQSVKLPQSYNLAVKKDSIDENYFLPTMFIKNTFFRKNIIELEEVELKIASNFDVNRNLVEWNNPTKIIKPRI